MSEPSRGLRPQTWLQRLQQLQFSFAAERVLTASLQLDLFSHIAAGKKTAAGVAAAAGASERGTRMLLDALVGLELVGKREGGYELPAESARYLVRESPDYVGTFLTTEEAWNAWAHLTEAVKQGKARQSASTQEAAEEFFPGLVRTLHITHGEPARRLAEQVTGRGAAAGRVLDIGCGSGVWSIAIAKADPSARVTALDYPKVLETTREYVEGEGLKARYEYMPGDLRSMRFPEGRYNLAILGNIVHGDSEAAARDLFGRIHDALAAGGRLAILEMIPNDERTGPPFPLLFALNMLVHTDEGDTYTLAQYRDWLKGAGFEGVETVDIASHSPAILATRG